jgi:hypothetical protein
MTDVTKINLTVFYRERDREPLYRSMGEMPVDSGKARRGHEESDREKHVRRLIDESRPMVHGLFARWVYDNKDELENGLECLGMSGVVALVEWEGPDRRGGFAFCDGSALHFAAWDYANDAFLCQIRFVDGQPSADAGKAVNVAAQRNEILKRWARESVD